VAPGSPGLAAVVERFGADMLRPDGSLDRARLADVVFTDPAARRDLESITHPCVRAAIDTRLASLRRSPRPPAVVVVEHPLLVESDGRGWVDTIVVVEAPPAERVRRLSEERGMAADQVQARMAAQADDETRRGVADLVIVNDGDLEALDRAAGDLLRRLVGHP